MKSRFLALTALITLLTAACGGHGGGSSAIPAASNADGASGATSFSWGKEQLDGATYTGPASVGHMQVFVQTKLQNAQALGQYAQQVSDPSSPLYRQFLTPQDIAQRFGASQQDYQATADYFVSNGLSVAGWPQRLMLSVSGSQAAMERAFGTKFGLYTKNGVQFVAPRSTPRFSAAIPVTHVGNLVAMRRLHTYIIPAPPRANANDTWGYSPEQIRAAFDYNGAYSAGYTGSGITVAVIGTGPINIPRNGGADPCGDVDAAALASLYHVSNVANICERDVTPSGVSAGLAISGIPTAAPGSPAPNATPSPNPGVSPSSMFPYSGNFQTPPPVSQTACSGSLPACNPEDLEAQLDSQQIAFLAPGANVKFYLAYNASDCYVYYPQTCNATGSNKGAPQIGLIEADAEIQQIIADNSADVVSLSYGGGETQQGFPSGTNPSGYETVEFAAMAAEGMAIFASSGDNGSAECLGNSGYQAKVCVSYPSGDPNVTSVGGVNLPVNEFGQLTANMTAWGVTNGGNSTSSPGGSGGGISTIFSAPSWQSSALGASMREQPDVSLDADPFSGVVVETNGTCQNCAAGPSGIGGTSVAAPQMAAMWALVLDACKKAVGTCGNAAASHPWRLGNAAPYFYSIYKNTNLVPSGQHPPVSFPFLPYSQVFYDVVYGNNAMPGIGTGATPVPGQNAGSGYDLVTGIGVPFARHLITAVTNK